MISDEELRRLLKENGAFRRIELCPDQCGNKGVICEDCVKLSHYKQKED